MLLPVAGRVQEPCWQLLGDDVGGVDLLARLRDKKIDEFFWCAGHMDFVG